MKTTAIAGHLATFQIATAVEPTPSGPATASTTGPLSTSPTTSITPSRIMVRVTAICSGRSFQKGCPSRVS
jgi:hypothetical protein